MKTLRLTKPWHGPKGIMPPGEYRIPADIGLTHAKCARGDGAGEIVEAAGFRGASRKAPAPENKAILGADENKSEVDGANCDSGGERAEPKPRASRRRAAKPPADAGGQ